MRYQPNGDTVAIHECSQPDIGETTIAKCRTCPKQRSMLIPITTKVTADTTTPPAELTDKEARKRKKKDPVRKLAIESKSIFVTRHAEPINLQGLFQGASLFVVLSGPSTKSMDLSVLNRRGIITMGVNNSPAVYRPHIWTHGDPPKKFHQSIWRDPAVMKFMPVRSFSDAVRVKEDGQFKQLGDLCRDCPNVYGYQRNAFFNPDTFLEETSINWGNSEESIKKHGNPHPHVLNIMFVVLKLPWLLGFRTVYLLGCDFRMDAESGMVYGFDEDKHAAGCKSNNGTYLKVGYMCGLLNKSFDKSGYRVVNCTPRSGLIAFPTMPLEEAIRESTRGIPNDPLDTYGWYVDANPKKKRAA